MYKIVIFLKLVFRNSNVLLLGSFERSFRKLHRKIFLTTDHVSKVEFSQDFLENRHDNSVLNLAQLRNIAHKIL